MYQISIMSILYSIKRLRMEALMLVFISPSTQEYNEYISGGSEEYYMNLIADDLGPLLTNSGIAYVRNYRDGNVLESVKLSNAYSPSLHIALHSNASPPSFSGKLSGIDVYYYPGSVNGRRAADIFVEELRKIYPGTVRALTSSQMYELRATTAPTVLLELGYHDNISDEQWIRNNIQRIAGAIAAAIKRYLGV